MVRTLIWDGQALVLLDQTRLPREETFRRCTTYQEVAQAIKGLVVRGAPAIGVAAAYGLALAARASTATTPEALRADLRAAAAVLRQTRPTAVNLFWAIDRVLQAAAAAPDDPEAIRQAVLATAHRLAEEDDRANRQIGAFGADLIPPGARILTHCNAGGLGTTGYGTALGIIRTAVAQGKPLEVLVDETRPVLQGARLTTWELLQEGIPTTLITDNMAGFLMARGEVSLVLVGADRIAANGDVANKIGTYSLAVLAQAHRIPFYVAAPTSTVDLAVPSGAEIPIEERSPEEVTTIAGQPIAPAGVRVRNPAFDITPHRLVTAIITEVGVVAPPYSETLPAAVARARQGGS